MAKDWQAVAAAINARMEQLEMTQAELAKRSGVSVATLRQIQQAVPKRRGARTLADVSEALRWSRSYLEQVAEGEETTPENVDRVDRLEAELSALRDRVAAIERHTATPPAE